MAKQKIIKWEEGKMHLQPGNIYSMTGAELVDFGHRIDTNGYLIATTLTYEVNPFEFPGTGKWGMRQLKAEPLIIKENTPFKKIQERYPDAIKLEMRTNKMYSNKEILRHVYGEDWDGAMVLKNTSSATVTSSKGKSKTLAIIRAITSIKAKAEGHEHKHCYK